MIKAFLYRLRAALQRIKRRSISESGSRFSPSSMSLLLSSAVVASMIWLTWTPGLMNISAEGGPERSINGP